MIPKRIHYFWDDLKDRPSDLVQCMDTWHKFLPDYEFVHWTTEKVLALNNTFANEALSVNKYAFASDFLRLYAVYTYGGIWLDTDIEMFKSFDPFLQHKLFIGREANQSWRCNNPSTVSLLTSHCFGAEAGHPYLKACLDFYTVRHFIRCYSQNYPQEYRFDLLIIPQLQTDIAKSWGFDDTLEGDHIQNLKDGIVIYPHDYFDRPKYSGMKNVVCIHRQRGSWRPNVKVGTFKSNKDIYGSRTAAKRIFEAILIIVNKSFRKLHLKLKLIPI